MSVSVTSGETLRALNLTSATDIAQVTPGVWASGNLGGQSQQFSIRGVTQSDFNDAIEAPVAVYVRGGRVGLNRDWQRLIPDPVRADS